MATGARLRCHPPGAKMTAPATRRGGMSNEIFTLLQTMSTNLATMAADIAVMKAENEHTKRSITKIEKAVFEDNGSPCLMTRVRTIESEVNNHIHTDCDEEIEAAAQKKRRLEMTDKVKIAVYSSLAISVMWWLLGSGLLPALQNLFDK